jgi:prepilin peptidase CpaA
MTPETLLLVLKVLCLAVVVIGMVIDFRTMKIPNWLTFPAAAVGIILNAVYGYMLYGTGTGAGGQALDAFLGWCLGAGITVVFSLLPIGSAKDKEKLGMGDAKLMAAVGAFLGWKLALISFFYFCLSFGVISIVVLLKVVPWNALYFLLMSTFMGGGAKAAPTIDATKLNEQRKKPIPAGVAIAIGALLAIILEKQTLQYFVGP